MVSIIISPKIAEKLAQKHGVVPEEVMQCFTNWEGRSLLDRREEHATNPPTRWFISETDFGRKLKVIFVQDDGDIYLKSAFEPNEKELRIYNKSGRGIVDPS